MITNYTLLFYLKKPKKYESGAMPVYMRITVDGKCTELSVCRKCLPERWCSKSHQEKGNKDSTKGLNTYLDDLGRKLDEALLKLTNERKKISAVSLKIKFLDRVIKHIY